MPESWPAVGRTDQVVIIYPLWLGTMPAVLKAFLEQLFRPGFAIEYRDYGTWPKLLKGKSARVIITIGMPALADRFYFRAHARGLDLLGRTTRAV